MKTRPAKVIETVEGFVSNLPQDRQGMTLIYRGHECSSYKLIPSLYRQSNYPCNREKYMQIINDALTDLQSKGLIDRGWEDLDDFNKSSMAQHYGIPTPILDWTSDPKIALFFGATDISSDEDGEVIALYAKPKAQPDEGYDIDGAFPYLKIPEHCERHTVQKGLFTYNPIFDDSNPIPIDEIEISGRPLFYSYRYKISRSHRRSIQNELNDMDINFKTIYPDHEGITKHASWRIRNS